ncbi:hypothetical protein ATKI12_8892 [Kitasatospora sp. Ki12]
MTGVRPAEKAGTGARRRTEARDEPPSAVEAEPDEDDVSGLGLLVDVCFKDGGRRAAGP